MSEPKFTPGPWRINQAETLTRGLDITDGTYGDRIASVPLPKYTSDARQRADAALIAAAPALYRALKTVTAELKQMAQGEDCDHSVGICWCATFGAIENAESVLRDAVTSPHVARLNDQAT